MDVPLLTKPGRYGIVSQTLARTVRMCLYYLLFVPGVLRRMLRGNLPPLLRTAIFSVEIVQDNVRGLFPPFSGPTIQKPYFLTEFLPIGIRQRS